MGLAAGARMPHVRAIAADRLKRLASALPGAGGDTTAAAYNASLAADITRFLQRPAGVVPSAALPVIPPGAPIGQPGMEWLRRAEPACSWVP
jgi:hypothetical protein